MAVWFSPTLRVSQNFQEHTRQRFKLVSDEEISIWVTSSSFIQNWQSQKKSHFSWISSLLFELKKSAPPNFSWIYRKTFRWPFDSLQHYAFLKSFKNLLGNVSNSFRMKKYHFEHKIHDSFKFASSKNVLFFMDF